MGSSDSSKSLDMPVEAICIVGAGAIGRALTALLADSVPIYLLARGETARELNRHPIRIQSKQLGTVETSDYSVIEKNAVELLPESTAFFICTKAHQLNQALRDVRSCLTAKTPVFLFSNGISVLLDAAIDLRRTSPLYRALCYFGAYLENASTSAVQIYGTPRISLTALKEHHEQLEHWLAFLNSIPEIEVYTEVDVATAEWNKVCVNLIVNSLATLMGDENRVVAELPPLRALAESLFQEISQIAAAEGHHFDENYFATVLKGLEQYGDNTNSFLVDIQGGRRPEFDAIFGRVLKIAEANSVDAPILRTVARLLEGLAMRVAASTPQSAPKSAF